METLHDVLVLLSYKLYGARPPILLSFIIYGRVNPKIFRLSQALSGLIVHYIKEMVRRVQVRFKCSNFKHFISKTFVYLSLSR